MKEKFAGIISDTHDNKSAIHKAVEAFNNAGCSIVIHAGDFIAPFTIREFKNLACPLIGVFGNNDGERKGLSEQYSQIGSLHEPPFEFKHMGIRFVVMHEPDNLDKYRAKNDIDVIVYGHLHKIDIRQGKPLVINPGECCSWLTGRATIALLNLSTMKVDILDLDI